jgi:mono/diheme cytochrome c family protein
MRIHRFPEPPGSQNTLLESIFMMNRNSLGLAAATVALSLKLVVLVAFLPRPAVAIDLASPPAKVATAGRADPQVARGQYVARIAGCHDCHTEGYAEAAGELPANRWLTGSSVGFKGPWGVSYPTNLRLSVQKMTEAQWLAYARAPRLPPMPWFNLRDMADEDVRALYQFLRAIGPSGQAAPAPLAPDVPVTTPFIRFVPENLPVANNR